MRRVPSPPTSIPYTVLSCPPARRTYGLCRRRRRRDCWLGDHCSLLPFPFPSRNFCQAAFPLLLQVRWAKAVSPPLCQLPLPWWSWAESWFYYRREERRGEVGEERRTQRNFCFNGSSSLCPFISKSCERKVVVLTQHPKYSQGADEEVLQNLSQYLPPYTFSPVAVSFFTLSVA